LAWLDQRTGCKKLLHEALYENVPGGARWRYVWGSTLLFCFVVQVITGIFLWMGYSPSSQTAWESVYYIQHEMTGGWMLRGIHHFMAHAMTILLVLHLLQVVIDGAYKAPREINFWSGLVLMLLVLGLSLTGYLLPWDQKGYWASKVATNLVAFTPLIGPALQKVLIGGSDFGHHTLTRFFAFHAGLFPALVVLLVGLHLHVFRRHGLTAKEPKRRPDAPFWPDQVLKDVVACLAVLAVVLVFVLKPRWSGQPGGAELGAPADPSELYSAARPDWYFLFLFQLLKLFPGNLELLGAIGVPALTLLVLFLMPWLGRWHLGHRFNVGFLCALFAGIVALTAWALEDDRRDPEYQLAVRNAAREAERVKLLARTKGIPLTGAVTLLREDAYAQGPKLFAKYCSSCHRFDGHDGLGQAPKDPPAASDLRNFATREWIAGLLDPERISTPHYFGATKFADGKMARFVKKDVAKYSPEEKEKLRKVIAAVSAEAQLKAQRALDQMEQAEIVQGRALLSNELNCTECHQFHKPDEDATAPDLTGYGSRDWLVAFIGNPAHARFYGRRNDHMPAFADEKVLSPQAIGMLADWLRGEWFEPEEDPGTETRN
jgi:ubiquinol-cytochrome c reductase cytochrome b subunit